MSFTSDFLEMSTLHENQQFNEVDENDEEEYDEYENDEEEYDEYENDEEEYDEYDEEEEYERKEKEKNLQSWKNKMMIVHDHLLRRNDPFYTAAINSAMKKENTMRDQEFERHITALITILGNELRNSNTSDIEEECMFRVESKLVKDLLGCGVDDEFIKKNGCSVYVDYTKDRWGGKVEVFDGTYMHELHTFANVSVVISNLKKEMIAECLYDTKLVCKDVASLITTFI